MDRSRISRRQMLGGAAGAAFALPPLEILRGSRRALAAGELRPKRFILCQAGCSISGCYQISDGRFDLVTPLNEGASYEIPLGLQAIKEVQSDMGLVSGLFIPKGPNVPAGAAIPSDFPPAGTSGFHGVTHVQQFAGTVLYNAENINPCAASCDQLLAPLISTPDQYMKTLPLMLEAYYDRGSAGEYGYLSWEAPAAGAQKDSAGRPRSKGLTPYLQPSEIWRKLFDPTATSALGPPTSPEALEMRKRHKRSVLDALQKRTNRLLPRLGRHDKVQMELWRDHLGTLAKQIDKLDFSKCMAPAPITPAMDPKAGTYYTQDATRTEIYDVNLGWGNETQRAEMQADLIHAAFLCDRTRVVSWLMTGPQANINMYPISGIKSEMHAISHLANGIHDQMALAVNWHLKPIARLVKLLKQTDDYDGSKMIDNTVILLIFEGGWGHNYTGGGLQDTDGEYGRGLRFAHSCENMIVVMAGGKNLGIQSGQHIRYPLDSRQNNNVSNVHPGQVVLTVLRQMGYTGRFGEVPNVPLDRMLKAG